MEKIVDYLIKEKIENDDKNLFGQYSSKRLKLLSEIIAAYQKENIHLAQAASLLTSFVNFDMYSFIYLLLTTFLLVPIPENQLINLRDKWQILQENKQK